MDASASIPAQTDRLQCNDQYMEISFIAWGALQLFETMRLQGLQPNMIVKPRRSVHAKGLDSTEGLAPMRLRDV